MKYRKKPIVIEAFLWFGGESQTEDPPWIMEAIKQGKVKIIPMRRPDENRHGDRMHMIIETLEGNHRAEIGDYIIKGIKNELYPCKPDIFAATYEPVEDE